MAYNRQTHGARQHHIVPLPAKCPELNPVENIWQFMRDNWLSNRIFTSYDHFVDHCCEVWSKLIDQPWRIMTIGRRNGREGHDPCRLVSVSLRANRSSSEILDPRFLPPK